MEKSLQVLELSHLRIETFLLGLLLWLSSFLVYFLTRVFGKKKKKRVLGTYFLSLVACCDTAIGRKVQAKVIEQMVVIEQCLWELLSNLRDAQMEGDKVKVGKRRKRNNRQTE
jgi:hypothetical protein